MHPSTTRKRPTNLSLSAELVDEARALDINVSETCERALVIALKKARAQKWLEENLPKIHAWNAWIEENGMPYDEYRQF